MSSAHRSIRSLGGLTLVLVGCESPTRVLVDLPQLRVVTPPTSRGSPVVLEVLNTTPFTVSFEALACTTQLQQLIGDTWREVEPTGGPCTGLPLELPPDARHPVSVDTPTDRAGRFRATVEGSGPEGPFVIRSQPFDME